MNNLVAIYCRLSKEDIDKESFRESINNQSAMLLDYAYKHHFQNLYRWRLFWCRYK